MKLTSKPARVISFVAGVLMCMPAVGLGTAKVLFHQELGGFSMIVADGGTISLSSRQVWAALCVLALIGTGLIVFGIYVLSPSKSDR